MTTHPTSTPARRSNADYRWTTAKVTAFLRALSRCGSVAEAARGVGMSRKSAYELKARLADPRFQQMWAMAQRTGRVVRAAARAPAPSPWGEAGLAGLAHLSGKAPEATARRPVAGPQGDTPPAQGDTFARKVTF